MVAVSDEVRVIVAASVVDAAVAGCDLVAILGPEEVLRVATGIFLPAMVVLIERNQTRAAMALHLIAVEIVPRSAAESLSVVG